MSWDRPDSVLPRGTDLASAESLGRLREQAFCSAGLPEAIEILYGVGYTEGRVEAIALMTSFEDAASTAPRLAGPGLQLRFTPDGPEPKPPFGGQLQRSPEAARHLAAFPRSEGPVCFVSAGYAAGWYSEVLRQPVVVREIECCASGAPACRFEALPASQLGQAADPLLSRLVAALDFQELSRCAHRLVEGSEDYEGSMLGRFDPMSPAAHVWGPVMILPDSGCADSEDALETIQRDVGPEKVRVVLVDMTGARIRALEAVGLARLLDRVEGLGVEPILVGLDRNATGLLPSGRGLSQPLVARDLAEGIALGFQICLGEQAVR